MGGWVRFNGLEIDVSRTWRGPSECEFKGTDRERPQGSFEWQGRSYVLSSLQGWEYDAPLLRVLQGDSLAVVTLR